MRPYLFFYFYALLWSGGLYYLIYYVARHESLVLITVYLLTWLVFLAIWHQVKIAPHLYKHAIFIAVIGHCIGIVAMPGLSDDFYRFIWDGWLQTKGLNPFSVTPEKVFQGNSISNFAQNIYQNLNSAQYYSVYPPVCQGIYYTGALLFPDNLSANIIYLRIIQLLAVAGIGYCFKRLLHYYNLSNHYLFLFLLNPLVVLELTVNLHPEALMLFFFAAGLLAFHKDKIWLSGALIGLSVASKLLPLMFMPFFIKRLAIKERVGFFTSSGIVILLCFIPYLSQSFVYGFFDSIGLYFQKFEFNGSIYFIFKILSEWITGYSPVRFVAVIFALFIFVKVIHWAWTEDAERNNIEKAAFVSLTLYLLLTTTVHPWYVAPLLFLGLLNGSQYVIAWSAVIILSYTGYTPETYQHPYWAILLEYILVFYFMYRDWQKGNLVLVTIPNNSSNR